MTKKILKKRASQLYRDGYSYGEIAVLLKRPKSTVYRWVTDNQQQTEALDYEEQEDNAYNKQNNETNRDEFSGNTCHYYEEIANYETNWNENAPNQAFSTFENWRNELQNCISEEKNSRVSNKLPNLRHIFQNQITVLIKRNEKLSQQCDLLGKRLKIMVETNIKMSHDLEIAYVENGFLEEKVKSLSRITGTSVEFLTEELKIASVKTNLWNLINDYLELEGKKCSLQNIQSLYKHILELQSAFIPLAETKFRKPMIKKIKRTLAKFSLELEVVLYSFEEDDTDEIELTLDEKFKWAMENWMEEMQNDLARDI